MRIEYRRRDAILRGLRRGPRRRRSDVRRRFRLLLISRLFRFRRSQFLLSLDGTGGERARRGRGERRERRERGERGERRTARTRGAKRRREGWRIRRGGRFRELERYGAGWMIRGAFPIRTHGSGPFLRREKRRRRRGERARTERVRAGGARTRSRGRTARPTTARRRAARVFSSARVSLTSRAEVERKVRHLLDRRCLAALKRGRFCVTIEGSWGAGGIRGGRIEGWRERRTRGRRGRFDVLRRKRSLRNRARRNRHRRRILRRVASCRRRGIFRSRPGPRARPRQVCVEEVWERRRIRRIRGERRLGFEPRRGRWRRRYRAMRSSGRCRTHARSRSARPWRTRV